MNAPATLAAHVSRQLAIGPHHLVVFDGLFDAAAIASTFTFVRRSPYHLNDYDSEQSTHVLHWKAEFPVALAEGTPVFRDCIRITRDLVAPAPLTLDRVHANLETYGDMMFPHPDLEGGVTAVYYANPVWERDWQGETVFYAGGEPVHMVAPRPGRLVVFDADIVHRVGVPSRECYVPRITIAFKFTRG
jgi:Rps23 Pro-64 3,4-dihydroxylase Tpa1-like proline 4-hydroxylase